MSGHTPGKWMWDGAQTVRAGPAHGPRVVIAQQNDSAKDIGFQERRANARLIAAAPLLLEVALKVRDIHHDNAHGATFDACDYEQCALARAALAAATQPEEKP